MTRRQKFRETAIFETLIGFAALVLSLWFISSGLWSEFQVLLFSFLVTSLIALVTWITHRLVMVQGHSPALKTFVSNFCQTEESIRRELPTRIFDEPRTAQSVPEPTIYEKLRKMDWFQFEKLIELIYRHRGFSVKRLSGGNPDGGTDLVMTAPAEIFVVQCKHWRNRTVNVRHIREFLGALTDTNITRGIFITLRGYTVEAQQLADKHGIQILSAPHIIEMLEKTGLIATTEVSELFSDDRKFCPKCESAMVLRTSGVDGGEFWGCSKFPRCRFTSNLEA